MGMEPIQPSQCPSKRSKEPPVNITLTLTLTWQWHSVWKSLKNVACGTWRNTLQERDGEVTYRLVFCLRWFLLLAFLICWAQVALNQQALFSKNRIIFHTTWTGKRKKPWDVTLCSLILLPVLTEVIRQKINDYVSERYVLHIFFRQMDLPECCTGIKTAQKTVPIKE